LNNYLFIGRTLGFGADLDAKIKALTPEQIIAAMRRHIDPTKITIVKAGDFAKNSSQQSGAGPGAGGRTLV
jgi:zinc protease